MPLCRIFYLIKCRELFASYDVPMLKQATASGQTSSGCQDYTMTGYRNQLAHIMQGQWTKECFSIHDQSVLPSDEVTRCRGLFCHLVYPTSPQFISAKSLASVGVRLLHVP